MVGKASSSSKKAAATLEEAPEAAAPEAAAEAPAAEAAEAAAEEAPAADAPAEEKKEEAKTEEEKTDKKKKPKKKVVPSWATLDDSTRSKLAKAGSLPKPKVQDAILEAIKLCGDSKGAASASAIRSMVMSDNPELPKMVLKKAMAKAVERGLVAQIKGKGFSGSFKLGKGKPVKKAEGEKGKKVKKDAGPAKAPLEELFPLVFTWACNPKEASVGLIKKYVVANYPELELGEESKHYRKALEAAEKHGSLERITGKGFNGTFALVDGASKAGGRFDDAFENALIAMNEPKDLSVSKLRDYLSCYHPEYNTDNRPHVLKSALDRAAAQGWVQQISGKGFTGTYRLSHNYYPSPRELWGNDFVEPKAKEAKEARGSKASPAKATPKKAAKRAVSESEDEEEDEEEEEAYKPKAKKRGAPTPRKEVVKKPKAAAKAKATKATKAKPVVAKKSKPAKGAVNKSRKGASRGKK